MISDDETTQHTSHILLCITYEMKMLLSEIFTLFQNALKLYPLKTTSGCNGSLKC